MPRTSSSEAEVSTERLPGLRIPGLKREGSLGFLAWPEVGKEEEIKSSRSSTWMAGVELRSSVTMDGISGLLPLSMLQRIEDREKNRINRSSCQG